MLKTRLAAALVCCAIIFELSVPTSARAQFRCVALTIVDALKKPKQKIVAAAMGAAVYQQNLYNGSVSVNSASTVAYAASVGPTITAQDKGVVDSVSINGDIAGKFKSVVISGHLTVAPGGHPVAANFRIAATKLKRVKVVSKGGKKFVKLTGLISYTITDAATGKAIYRAAPAKFSKLRTFAYQWKSGPCGSGGGVKR